MSRVQLTRLGFGTLYVDDTNRGLFDSWVALGYVPHEPEAEDLKPKPVAKKATTPRRRK